MRDHPPIPVSDLADNIERLKANDGLKFSQEYEVSLRAARAAGCSGAGQGPSTEGLVRAELCLPCSNAVCSVPPPALGACQLSLPTPRWWELALSS